MLIDIHVHLNFGGLTEDRIATTLEAGLVEMMCVSALEGGYYPTLADVQRSNDLVYRLMRRSPDRVVGFAYVNPAHGDAALDELRRCVEMGFRGVKLWVATLCDDPRVNPVVEQAIAHNLPLLVHCWVKTTGNLPFESTPMHLGRLAGRFPEAQFIMAHLGGDWEYGLKVAAEHSNIWVDVSGSLSEMDAIERLAETVGVERLLFGTDNSDLSFCKGKVLGADLTDEEREAIFWRNAAKLLDLPATAGKH